MGAAVAAWQGAARSEPVGWDDSAEEQRGDLAADFESILIKPRAILALSGDTRADFRPRAGDFADIVATCALTFVGKSRSNARPLISSMLEIFDLPFESKKDKKLVPFCASGITYITALAYLSYWGKKASFENLQGALPEIDHYHFFPSPSVWDMYYVALGKRRWMPFGRSAPRPGWLVVYDFGKGADHVGLVLSVDEGGIHTFECNTSGKIDGSQQNGGVITTRYRELRNIKGYIRTDLQTPI